MARQVHAGGTKFITSVCMIPKCIPTSEVQFIEFHHKDLQIIKILLITKMRKSTEAIINIKGLALFKINAGLSQLLLKGTSLAYSIRDLCFIKIHFSKRIYM